MYGHSGIMSFYHKGGLEESKKLLQELKLITLAESLGGYESLAELPYLVKPLKFGQNNCGRLFLKYFIKPYCEVSYFEGNVN
jgi:O-acetylhomoserine/O-acetylserine sulfhydrylase-like pyridoxal-dependent enzyme